MMEFIFGFSAGMLFTSGILVLAIIWPNRKPLAFPLSTAGSPVVSRRTTEKKKPKVQDDQKAWVQEQKEPREIG